MPELSANRQYLIAAAPKLLEGKLQPELNDSRVVSVNGMEEGASSQAVRSASPSSRIIDRGPTVAADDIVAGISGMGRVVDPELRVVEYIECFGAELQVPLTQNFEVFQQ